MKKKIGRPLKPALPGTRVSLGLKVTPKMKECLEAEAKKNGRTQSQEAELRLEFSFSNDRIKKSLEEVLISMAKRKRVKMVAKLQRAVD